MNEKNRQLGLALDSDEVLLVEQWLAEVLAEGATLPPTDEAGRVDPAALTFRAGQLSVLNKLRGMRAALRPKG
jgi:hypothetical protein